jgi:hypothetical protein
LVRGRECCVQADLAARHLRITTIMLPAEAAVAACKVVRVHRRRMRGRDDAPHAGCVSVCVVRVYISLSVPRLLCVLAQQMAT